MYRVMLDEDHQQYECQASGARNSAAGNTTALNIHATPTEVLSYGLTALKPFKCQKAYLLRPLESLV